MYCSECSTNYRVCDRCYGGIYFNNYQQTYNVCDGVHAICSNEYQYYQDEMGIDEYSVRFEYKSCLKCKCTFHQRQPQETRWHREEDIDHYL